jgi:hypothetical protein
MLINIGINQDGTAIKHFQYEMRRMSYFFSPAPLPFRAAATVVDYVVTIVGWLQRSYKSYESKFYLNLA